MDLNSLPECGLHKRINFNLWYFQICQTTELTTLSQKSAQHFVFPPGLENWDNFLSTQHSSGQDALFKVVWKTGN